MHLIIIQLQRQSPPIFGLFPSGKLLSLIHVFHRKIARWHSHKCIQCFKFPLIYAIILHPNLFGKSTFTYSCACKAKVASSVESKLQRRNWRTYWNLEVFARVPRLESNYVYVLKLQPLYFVTCSFWRGLQHEGWNLYRAHICEVLPKHKIFMDNQNGIWQALKTSTWNTQTPGEGNPFIHKSRKVRPRNTKGVDFRH